MIISSRETLPIQYFFPLFTKKIKKKNFAVIRKDGNVFCLEDIVLSDNEEMMIIYSVNDERMGVTVALPFITGVRGFFPGQMYRTAAVDK